MNEDCEIHNNRVPVRSSGLVGRLADQAALSGVLNSLYELHLPVLSADCVDSENSWH
jgi:hypothetical protein